jgi:sugar lactone lactonase YvrE
MGAPGSANGQLNHPEGAAVDSTGHVYVADTANARVEKFNPNASWSHTYGAGAGFAPTDVAVVGSNLYTASPGRIDVWNLTLDLHVRSWSTAFNAYGIAADATGNSYVSDPQHGLVHVFNGLGVETGSWSSLGAGLGLTQDSAGSIYVAEPGLGRIAKFSSAGAPQASWSMPSYSGAISGTVAPVDVAVDSGGRVFAPDSGTSSNLTAVLAPDGTLQQLFGQPVTDPGNPCTLRSPWGVATSPSGALYVVSTGEDRIRVFDESSPACPAPSFSATGGGGSGNGAGGGQGDGSNPSGATAGAVSDQQRPQIKLLGIPRHCARQNFSFQIQVTDDGVIKTLELFVNGQRAATQNPDQSEWNVKVRMPVRAVRRQLLKGTKVKVTVEVKVRDASGKKADLKKAFQICG